MSGQTKATPDDFLDKLRSDVERGYAMRRISEIEAERNRLLTWIGDLDAERDRLLVDFRAPVSNGKPHPLQNGHAKPNGKSKRKRVSNGHVKSSATYAYAHRSTPQGAELLAYLTKHPHSSAPDVGKALKIAKTAARKRLARLVALGLAERHGTSGLVSKGEKKNGTGYTFTAVKP